MICHNTRLLFISLGLLIFSGCKDENGNYTVGVGLGGTGTGTGGISVGTNKPDIKPNPTEDDVEYAVAYPNPITQNCGDIERTIRFVSHYSPYTPLLAGDRQDLFGINSQSLPPIRFKLQVIVKNTSSSKTYEYIDSCKATFQLVGSKTAKTTSTDYCLNDETVIEYQPNESRTYYYTFNLPNILQNWTASYHSQYAKAFDGSRFHDENLSTRTQCNPLTTQLLLDEYVSSRDDAPRPPDRSKGGDTDNLGTNYNENPNLEPIDPSPVFGGYDLDGGGDKSPAFEGFGL